MTRQTGNLSGAERTLSALVGLSFSMAALRGGSPLMRLLNGLTGAALLARSYAGHCAVKAALSGESSFGLRPRTRETDNGSDRQRPPGSTSDAVDTAVNDSYPASDPPASRLPDEPPINAEAKWEAARGAVDT